MEKGKIKFLSTADIQNPGIPFYSEVTVLAGGISGKMMRVVQALWQYFNRYVALLFGPLLLSVCQVESPEFRR